MDDIDSVKLEVCEDENGEEILVSIDDEFEISDEDDEE